MNKVHYPPNTPSWDWDPKKYKSVFLGGTIDNGNSEDWQSIMIDALKDENIILFNPRNKEWDSTLEQDINNPVFKKQVLWELEQIDFADLVILYFAPNSKSPITLLELGICAGKGKTIVCCPEGFWRKGNVDVVCEKYSIKQVDNLDELIKIIKNN